jgi:hypothetical protein
MENLLNDSVSNLVEQTNLFQDVDTLTTSKISVGDMESMIEVGILQDYLDILGKMEDN